MSEHSNLWNDLPKEERHRLMPHMLESQILHIEQDKIKVIEAHKQLIKRMNEHQQSIRANLNKLNNKGVSE